MIFYGSDSDSSVIYNFDFKETEKSFLNSSNTSKNTSNNTSKNNSYESQNYMDQIQNKIQIKKIKRLEKKINKLKIRLKNINYDLVKKNYDSVMNQLKLKNMSHIYNYGVIYNNFLNNMELHSENTETKVINKEVEYDLKFLKKVKDSIEYYKKNKLYEIVYKLEKYYFPYFEKNNLSCF